ncbi:MAG: SUMF1/EgtB/PvdO family nonheme iron enzyme [Oligoflexia bacterium]|nr:SUMF1/EgtB/PvdO family nonheme iron enzyme [Oligoflexia bacterium]
MTNTLNVLLKLIGPLLVLSAVSCLPKPSNNRPRAEVLFEDERDEDFRDQENLDSHTISCRSGAEESDKVSLNSLDYIDSNNAGAYILRGRCDERDKTVRITVNGYKISNNPVCDNKRWRVELDLSAIVIKEKSVVFQITHDDDRICKKVRVAFTGPVGYIPVPPLDNYYEFGFFVMKYEAKAESRNSSTKAVSKPDGAPLTRVTYEDAVTLCKNNGPRYDLINNSQWQNIVRSIEDTDENWSEGKNIISDNNVINCGVMRGYPQPAKSDDRKDCADYNCNSYWDVKRRTHILSNGERVWDICGNVGEMMKDKYKAGENFRGDVYELSGQLKKLFGPKRSYQLVNASRRTNKWNLGHADVKGNYNLIVRGMQGSFSGIFSVLVKRNQEDRRGDTYVGFRCVYLP